MRSFAHRSTRVSGARNFGRHFRSTSSSIWRILRSRFQPPRRRQRLDRDDLAQAIWRARAQSARTVCRDRRVPRGQRAGKLSFRRRPAEWTDPAEIRARAHQERYSATHLPRRIVLCNRDERTRLWFRPVCRGDQSDQSRWRLAHQWQQDLDDQRAYRQLHAGSFSHLAADKGEPPPRAKRNSW